MNRKDKRLKIKVWSLFLIFTYNCRLSKYFTLDLTGMSQISKSVECFTDNICGYYELNQKQMKKIYLCQRLKNLDLYFSKNRFVSSANWLINIDWFATDIPFRWLFWIWMANNCKGSRKRYGEIGQPWQMPLSKLNLW